MSEHITPEIKAVVFDFDDTLVGTHIAIWALHRHVAQTYYGRTLQDDELLAHWGRPLPELARQYYKTDDTDLAVHRMIEHQLDFPKAKFEHADTAIAKLKQSGRHVGMVTAAPLPVLEKDADIVGLSLEPFEYIQTAEDTDFHKPDPQVFVPMLAWASKLGYAENSILYVGDGLQDMHAANGAGLNFLGVCTGLVTAEEFADNGAASVQNLSEL